jgi:hypothetical protein
MLSRRCARVADALCACARAADDDDDDAALLPVLVPPLLPVRPRRRRSLRLRSRRRSRPAACVLPMLPRCLRAAPSLPVRAAPIVSLQRGPLPAAVHQGLRLGDFLVVPPCCRSDVGLAIAAH